MQTILEASRAMLDPKVPRWTCSACRKQLSKQLGRRHANTMSRVQAALLKPPKEAPILKPLDHPLGVDEEPQPGDNAAKETRVLDEVVQERMTKKFRLEQREKLLRQLRRPNVYDMVTSKHHKGKTFLAPDRLLRAEAAKYMPNMQGYTFDGVMTYKDTTSAFRGKVSLFTIFNTHAAQEQIDSFVGETANPELQRMFTEMKPLGFQRCSAIMNETPTKALLTWLFMPWARKNLAKMQDWRRTFVMRKGCDRDVTESFGLLNRSVGHLYLIDRKCRIRWAANGFAQEGEVANLNAMAKKLVMQEVEEAARFEASEKKRKDDWLRKNRYGDGSR